MFIEGPRNRENTYCVAIFTIVTPAEEMTLDAKVTDYLSKASRAREFKLVSKARGTLASAEAVELLTSYKMVLPLHSVHPKDTAIVERRIIVKRDSQFYELVYRTVEEDYYTYLHAFEHAVRTFEFAGAEMREFRPLVIPAPELALAEGRGGYTTKK